MKLPDDLRPWIGIPGVIGLPFGFGALIQFTDPNWITIPLALWCLIGTLGSAIAVLSWVFE